MCAVCDRWRESAGDQAVGDVSSLGRSAVNHQVHSPHSIFISRCWSLNV